MYVLIVIALSTLGIIWEFWGIFDKTLMPGPTLDLYFLSFNLCLCLDNTVLKSILGHPTGRRAKSRPQLKSNCLMCT